MSGWRANRRLGIGLLLSLALLAAAGALLMAMNHLDEGHHSSAPAPATASTPAEQVQRGAYLARAGNCMGCHTRRGGAAYAGGLGIPTPFGTVFAPNLTPDPATGLGDWSREDFWHALHHGRGRDGRLLTPVFPYSNYSLVNRDDSDALWAYLQSLPPEKSARRAHELRFPYNTQLALAVWRALYFRPQVFKPNPSESAAWNRGAYLAQGLGHCNACHGPRNAWGATSADDDFGGSRLDALGWYAPSLHDPSEASVSGWTPEALRDWLRSGVSPKANASGPMAEVIQGSTQYLNDADLDALGSYLRALPVRTATNGPAGPNTSAALRPLGEKLYEVHCAQCHGGHGEGAEGAYPALAGNRALLMSRPDNLLRMLMRGGFAPTTVSHPRPYGMPPFSGLLSDQELAAVASFVRNAWGNRASDVSALDVLRLKDTRVD